MTLPLSEVFGCTLQGEGPAAGQASWFIRFGGCNLSCSWCDTPYTWDASRFDLRKELTPTSPAEILAQLSAPEGSLIVLSGGETLLNQMNPAWEELLTLLRQRRYRLHVETNGTIKPTAATVQAVEQFIVSPKMAHAGSHKGRQNPTPWAHWHHVDSAVLKVVVESGEDVATVAREALAAGWPPHRTWVMPQGVTTAALQARWPEVAAAAAAHGINASHRLHVLAWQEARGH